MKTPYEFSKKYPKGYRIYFNDGSLVLEDNFGLVLLANTAGISLMISAIPTALYEDFKELADTIFHYTYKDQDEYVKCYQVIKTSSLYKTYGININMGIALEWCVLCIEGKRVSVVHTCSELLQAKNYVLNLEVDLLIKRSKEKMLNWLRENHREVFDLLGETQYWPDWLDEAPPSQEGVKPPVDPMNRFYMSAAQQIHDNYSTNKPLQHLALLCKESVKGAGVNTVYNHTPTSAEEKILKQALKNNKDPLLIWFSYLLIGD